MGQITIPTRADVILTAIDRLVARNANGGLAAGAQHVVLLGENAGQNTDVSNLVVIGGNSLQGGYTADVNGPGTTIVGAQSLSALINSTESTSDPGPVTAFGGFIAPLLTQRLGSAVLIGSEVGEDYPALGAEMSSSVVIGAQALQRQRTLAVNGPGALNSVIIGFRAARGVANTVDGAGSHIQTSVVIGSEAAEATGTDLAVPGNTFSQNVVIGFQAGRALASVQNRSAQLNVMIGNTVVSTMTRGVENVFVGAGITATDNIDRNVAIGANIAANITTVRFDNIFIGSGIISDDIGSRNIILGARNQVGSLLGSTVTDRLLIETHDGTTRRCHLYSVAGGAANGVVIGQSTQGTNRDLPGTNLLKLINGTTTGSPVGGGNFYAAGGEGHFVTSAGVDRNLTPAGQLASQNAAFTNNAGAALGTLTNSPTAGDPTKWIPINDNGTIRNIPAW